MIDARVEVHRGAARCAPTWGARQDAATVIKKCCEMESTCMPMPWDFIFVKGFPSSDADPIHVHYSSLEQTNEHSSIKANEKEDWKSYAAMEKIPLAQDLRCICPCDADVWFLCKSKPRKISKFRFICAKWIHIAHGVSYANDTKYDDESPVHSLRNSAYTHATITHAHIHFSAFHLHGRFAWSKYFVCAACSAVRRFRTNETAARLQIATKGEQLFLLTMNILDVKAEQKLRE